MKPLLILLFICGCILPCKAQELEPAVYANMFSAIADQTVFIEVGNLNCKLVKKAKADFGDFIGFENGKYAPSMELPLEMLGKEDTKDLLYELTHELIYETSCRENDSVIVTFGACACIQVYTVVLFFKNSKNEILAQLLIDPRISRSALYVTANADPVIIELNQLTINPIFYIFKKYSLSCLER